MTKALLVEDDIDLAASLVQSLSIEGYTVEVTNSGEDASFRLLTYPYDVIILDLTLPDKSGLQVLKEFRSTGGSTPIIILTGRDGVSDKALGLDSGADDYLTKPFHLKELSARLRALCRRFSNLRPDKITIGSLQLDTTCKTLSKDGVEIRLMPRDYALMEFLMLHPREVFSSDALLARVWESESDSTDEAIRSAFKRIRKAIGDTDCRVIQNVRKLGYMLTDGGAALGSDT